MIAWNRNSQTHNKLGHQIIILDQRIISLCRELGSDHFSDTILGLMLIAEQFPERDLSHDGEEIGIYWCSIKLFLKPSVDHYRLWSAQYVKIEFCESSFYISSS